MPRLHLLLAALPLLACSDGKGPPPGVDCPVVNGLTLPPTSPGSPGPPGASIGSVVKGAQAYQLNGAATVYRHGSTTAAFTVLDAFTRDADHRPTGELFLFLRTAGSTSVEVVPVTLAQVNDKNFVPTGAFAVYADSYSETVGDYTRWLLATSGCIRSTNTGDAVAPRVEAFVHVTGDWQSNTGAALGPGSASVLISAPVLDYRSLSAAEGMLGSVGGVRNGLYQASTLDAFQVLHPSQTRLVIVGTQPADTTREIWLSLAGVPQDGDSIPLSEPTLEEARVGRTAGNVSFGMMRLLQLDDIGRPIVREIWRSSGGYVKLDSMVQNGPLGLCGVVGAAFAMTMQGVNLATGAALGTSGAEGTVTTRMTILPQSDTLRDPALLPSPVMRRFRFAAPTSTGGLRCP